MRDENLNDCIEGMKWFDKFFILNLYEIINSKVTGEDEMRNKFWLLLGIKDAFLFLTVILFYASTFQSCASEKSVQSTEYLSYEYNGEKYRIRSILSGDNELSFNELVGKKFVAKDYDQDGFIDEITLGEINIREAQEIYEYTLTMLTLQNKLNKVSPKIKVYQYANTKYNYEIKSFHSGSAEPFNQFKIIMNGRKLNPEIVVSIDKGADGILDEVVTGTMSLEEIQTLYAEVIQEGLKKNELTEIDNIIIVK